MTDPARVSTVVLNWNHPAMTLDCVRHLLATQPVAAGTVVVIDNGSSAQNAAALRDGLPAGVDFVRNDRNLGFAAGMNVGIRRALQRSAEYVWLLNNDAFPRPGCLPALTTAMDSDRSLAATTPMLFYPDGRPQLIGGRFEWGNPVIEPLFAGQLPPRPVVGIYVTGAALFVRAAALKHVGTLDPRFFAYWEEVDLCVRFIRGKWNLAGVPAAECVHIEGATSGDGMSPFTQYMFTRNSYLIAYKNLPARRAAVAGLRLTAEAFDRALWLRRHNHSAVAAAMLAGASDGLLHRFGPPPAGTLDAPRLRRALYWKPWRSMPLLQGLTARLAAGYRPPVED